MSFEIVRSDGESTSVQTSRDVIRVGSSPLCEVQLEGAGIAGIHAIVKLSESTLSLTDLGSALGTSVNGVRVQRADLSDGDRFKVGETEITLRRVKRPAAKRPLRFVRSTHRPSDYRRYAKRFLSQPSRTDGTVEVAHLYRDHVMDELVLTARSRRGITIGEASGNDIVLGDKSIPSASFPLLERRKGGELVLRLAPEMVGDIFIHDQHMTVEEARAGVAASGFLVVGPKTRARLVFGDSTLFVHQGTEAQVVLPFRGWDKKVLGGVVVSAAVHVALLAWVWLQPPAIETLTLDSFATEERLVDFSMALAENEPETIPEIDFDDGFGDQGETDPSDTNDPLQAGLLGDGGETGDDQADRDAEGGHLAIEGSSDHRRPEQRPADQLSALAVLNAYSGPTLFGEQPMAPVGIDDFTAISARYNPNAQPSYLAMLNIGPGGDGTGTPLPGGATLWSGSCFGCSTAYYDGSDLVSGTGDGLPGDRSIPRPPQADPAAEVSTLGDPEIGGHLDRSIVQRIIRQNRRRIRACYEDALRGDSTLEGRIMMSFTIDPTGNVAAAEVVESTMGSDDVNDCLERRISQLSFPAAETPGITHVNYPFQFVSGG